MTASIKSRETYIRRLAGSCGCRFEKPRDPGQYGGWTYILWDDNTDNGLGADDPDEFETCLREQYPNIMPRKNNDWSGILATAKQIVESYDTGVTLRQLFYQLVARQILQNNTTDTRTFRYPGARPSRWQLP